MFLSDILTTSICSDTFHEVGSGSGLNDAHVGDVGVLSISERAVSASIEASMHTPYGRRLMHWV